MSVSISKLLADMQSRSIEVWKHEPLRYTFSDTPAAGHINFFPSLTEAPLRPVATHPVSVSASASMSVAPPPSQMVARSLSQADRVYDVLATSKIETARVAAHLPDHLRSRLFRQLDQLHDVDEWEEGDAPAKPPSFTTFLRFMLVLIKRFEKLRWPSLGLTASGNLVASWGYQHDHLVIEFLPSDETEWSLTVPCQDDSMASHVGRATILNVLRFLAPYQPEHWFNAGR